MNIDDWMTIYSVLRGQFPEVALDNIDDLNAEDSNFYYKITIKNKTSALSQIQEKVKNSGISLALAVKARI